MTRAAPIALGAGVLGLLALFALHRGGQSVLPSYLSAWLFVLALPAGALPLVLGSDLLGRPETSTVAALRAMLPLIGLALVLAVPLLLGRATLYPTPAVGDAFAAAWMSPGAVSLRGALAFAAWIALAALVRRPAAAPSRRGIVAGLGLVLHLVLGTLVAGDWVAALEPGLNSSCFGLIVLLAQCGVALSAACLLVAGRGERSTPGLPAAVLVVLLAWLFLHFTQYLVVWSANLPDEVTWYLSRNGGLGGVAEGGAALVVLVAMLVLVPGRGGVALAGTAGLILLMHLLEAFWLVVPAGRGGFSLGWADLVAIAGLPALTVGSLLLLEPRSTRQGAAHGRP